MKYFIICLLFIGFNTNLSAQDFSLVDQKVATYKDRYESAEKLATKIDADFSTDLEKVRALFFWLTHNVAYDMNEFSRGRTQHKFQFRNEAEKQEKLKEINDRIISNTIASKKAVCEGYAQSFHKICQLLGIESAVIDGFSKTDFRDIGVERAIGDHAWNAVKIDGKWSLLDATWSAGSAQGNQWKANFDDFFFLTSPTVFLLTHLPYEQKWQLRKKPISQKQFFATPVFKKPFFDEKLKLISPINGLLKVKTNDRIKFKLENLPKNIRLFYAYHGDKFSQEIKPTCVNGVCSFSIPFPRESDAVLYLLAFRKVILEYKVEVKK